jgi:hypothetical protein
MADTAKEKDKFIEDAKKLTAVVVSDSGAMAHVADLLNIWGVFVPSPHVSTTLYELDRAHPSLVLEHTINLCQVIHLACIDQDRNYEVSMSLTLRELGGYVNGGTPKRERADVIMPSYSVCLRFSTKLRVGNDGLYGGLGGDFTVITASEINGPLVLRHELGHSLIEEGDEYDGSKSTMLFGQSADDGRFRLLWP